MVERLRIVIDSNVLVSRLLVPRSVPAEAVRVAANRHVLLVSEALMSELADVLARRKFDAYATVVDRQHFLRLLGRIATMVPILHQVRACRDPKDDMLLELAISGEAHFIVTGDADLLRMSVFRGVRILTPATYLESTG